MSTESIVTLTRRRIAELDSAIPEIRHELRATESEGLRITEELQKAEDAYGATAKAFVSARYSVALSYKRFQHSAIGIADVSSTSAWLIDLSEPVEASEDVSDDLLTLAVEQLKGLEKRIREAVDELNSLSDLRAKYRVELSGLVGRRVKFVDYLKSQGETV